VIRLAAAGDVHCGVDSIGTLGPAFASVSRRADVLLLAGDLTKGGEPEEAAVLATEIEGLGLPIVAVLGNHDYHAGREDEVRAELERAGVRVLECESIVVDLHGERLAVVGAKGFGGGFAGTCATDFGEAEMKAFVRHTASLAERLERRLTDVDADATVLLLHYSPVRDTLRGEPLELFPFLGSYLFAEVADRAGVDLVVHGHAHSGTERGTTPVGIAVRNVAQAVINLAYATYELSPGKGSAARPVEAAFLNP
jgi:Icc-related predicted phosphoesterase